MHSKMFYTNNFVIPKLFLLVTNLFILDLLKAGTVNVKEVLFLDKFLNKVKLVSKNLS